MLCIYRLYRLKMFVTQLGKIAINVGKPTEGNISEDYYYYRCSCCCCCLLFLLLLLLLLLLLGTVPFLFLFFFYHSFLAVYGRINS